MTAPESSTPAIPAPALPLILRNDPAAMADRRAAWLADRRRAITATDAAMILGLSKFGGPMDVFLDKTGQAIEKPVSAAMEWGRRLEQPILIAYADAIGGGIAFRDSFTLSRAREIPLVGATLDAVRLDDGRPVDAKNVRFPSAEWGESGTDKIPLYYAVQLYLQMFVEEKGIADLAVLFGGHDFRIYTLQRTESTMDWIIQQCLAFWTKHVEVMVPPPIDGSAQYADYLARTLVQTSDVMLDASPESEEIASKLSFALDEEAEVESRIETYKSTLKAAIGEAKGLAGAGFRATWSTSKDRKSTDYESVAADLLRLAGVAEFGHVFNDLVLKHSTTKPGTRSFRFSPK